MPFPVIPLFAERSHHPSVPLGRRPAGARSEGQGRPPAGASRAPFTGASTLAGWRRSGGGSVVLLAVLLLSSGIGPDAARAQDAPAERTATSHPWAVQVADAARRFGIPEAWIWAVMRVESNGDSRAVSSAGAMGLMQIMPGTWANLRIRHGLGRDPYNVRDNIMAGAAYLRAMHDRYGNATAMLAAYNAGPGRYDEYLSRGRPLPAETRAYLAKLAAITGSAGDSQLAAAPPSDRFAWRRAALFAARPNDDPAALETSPGKHADDMRAAVEPAANSLFVALSGRRQP
ncbi:lytic transglycosylase domain-containing protein [Sphingomonas sp. CL5.1]|uniref:lytic transglycosylase domain-containing protein n=1 Tax=Pseudomonadota TaxID=1224 RepID=UPI001582FFFF|nr:MULTISPECIES: lytic transglycosylase domain-containing protein [Pseudomonadota]MCE4542321.1 lytic transglycosylase domain-containing protein [Caballeronia sp. PC1]MCE4545064.1 lytic transglycosylase domain-containing protein [Caballeronia sp. PC1]MCE4568626.1 lytic transglycosylase domain-containing protein [Caballeronia sp. CLC5]MCE4570159.1 lytic transglycosylase domain-containing protein [Caballeronia sp. CLC5]QKR98482.1 lytic transglycosylase domain-containing protein [Sphingomonas sp. 